VQESLTVGYTTNYAYDDAGSNDAERSEAVAGEGELYDPAYTEYRGNAMVRETGPLGTDGQQRVTTTWYYQDDQRKGQSQGSLVGTQSFSDSFNALDGNSWIFQGGVQITETISGDGALKRWDELSELLLPQKPQPGEQ
jgi:hypothetical protein